MSKTVPFETRNPRQPGANLGLFYVNLTIPYQWRINISFVPIFPNALFLKQEIRANLAQFATVSTSTSQFHIGGGSTSGLSQYFRTRPYWDGTIRRGSNSSSTRRCGHRRTSNLKLFIFGIPVMKSSRPQRSELSPNSWPFLWSALPGHRAW